MSLDVINLEESSILSSLDQRLHEEPMYYFRKQTNNLICIFVNSLSNVGGLPREVLRIQDFSQRFTAVYFESSVRS